ncbi:MAG: hypothetical protein ABSF87_08875 [Xanthobacteraceae bacterium]|jgi:hypothetical protein
MTNNSKSQSASKEVSRWSLFGPPPILEGENAAAYDELFGRVCAAVKPVDVIDEMFMADVVASEWEVLRWRRLKLSLIRTRALKALEGFLRDKLDYDLYREHFVDELTPILQDNPAEDQAEDIAQTLAHECARNEPDAVDKVRAILAGIGLEINHILNRGKTRKAKELTQQYVRREPDAVKFIDEHLATAGVSIETLAAQALAQDLGYIERIDRLATIAESRRNASLHEIDRRRPILSETLRRSVQEVEDSEVIETTPAKGEALLDERPQDQS